MFLAPTGIGNWHHNVMQEELERLDAFITESEIGHSNSILEFYKKQRLRINKYDEYHSEVTFYHREMESSSSQYLEWLFKDEIPRLQRNSTFVTVISMFEKSLYDLCGDIEKELNIKEFKVIKKQGKLKSIKDYIHNDSRISIPDTLEENWQTLFTLNLIRNNIVHNYGQYEIKNEKVDNFIQKNENIKVSQDHNEFEMSNIFLTGLMPFFFSFCSELQKEMRRRKSDSEN